MFLRCQDGDLAEAEEPAQSAEPEAETENTEEQESNGETVQEDKAAGDSMKN